MTAYTVTEITNGTAKITFSDGSWTYLELKSDWTEADLDHMVYSITPANLKTTGAAPSFLKAGQTRTAAEKTVEEEG